ncbi:hypothetical protein RSOLAG22IIIB_03924 [Rhizoctonia solani]|uniref:Uncharacterized protein n=1 Tax=Rhizoctonia solani TaxID=456999 RepID=A0A0K6FTS9_9AGAM|nr:hypothetical protein RSOLAG22IIIB_03924 [Rhizoctonia solani]
MSLPSTDSCSHTDSFHSKCVSNDPAPEELTHRQPGRFRATYRRLSTTLGFKERFSLTFFIVFGGALLGFCLSRLMMLAPSNVIHKTVAGEWYWYRQALYKPNIFMHIYMSIVGGTLASLQFIPIIRRKKIIIHRINGWIVFLTLGVGSVAGSIVARRAFGGDLNSETAYYTLGFMIGPSAMLGVFFARFRVNVALHREWMLRTVSYSASVITARFITIMARAIISAIGTYYAMWRCDEIAFLLKDPELIQESFPICVNATRPKRTFVPVHASIHQDPINFGSTYRITFGMTLWLAILIHLAGTELYINLTKSYARPVQAHRDSNSGGEKV